MASKSVWLRRHFLKSTAGISAAAMLDMLLPAWAHNMEVTTDWSPDRRQPLAFDVEIREQRMNIAGGTGTGMTINGSIPGPLLVWREDQDVVVNVSNRLGVDTSIHWHGILLPYEMDGVPGVTFPGIRPGETFQYRFPVRQSGTYWYHSHSRLQEQSGIYGPLVIIPAGEEPVNHDRDYVVMLSDWTFEDPHRVLAKLKKSSDYYNYQQFSLADLYGTDDAMSGAEALRTKLEWDRMRMMRTDIADVTGATYTYLMNGLHPAGNWTGLFQPGERVRLRFINGSAMSYFNVRIPGLLMTVVAADGQNVEPIEVDEFQFGVGEVYDAIVQPLDDQPYTIMAESMDRSGYAAGTLTTRYGQRAPVPPLRKRPLLSMVDMGMDHMRMDGSHEGHSGHEGMGHAGGHRTQHGTRYGAESMPGYDDAYSEYTADECSHEGHTMHCGRSADNRAGQTSPVVARHGPDHHGPANAGVASVQRNRLGEPGTGLADVAHRVLVYEDLRRLAEDFDERPPAREVELHLTGHMERYMWSFDGKKFHEVDGPIEFRHGERLRLTMVNDTMMNHPIHLHGMWMEVENGQGSRVPRKHTINIMPASRVSALVSADAPGLWAFHCHLLYHMKMGMFRIVRVS